MQDILDALARGFKSLLHPRMLVLALWPTLLALVFWGAIAWLFWDRWTVDLRIDNYSSVPMRFDRVSLALSVDGESAGTLQGTPAITIGPESADVASLALAPTAAARLRVADALAAGRPVQYALAGRVDTVADGKSSRSFEIERRSSLSPVPGLPGVMR